MEPASSLFSRYSIHGAAVLSQPNSDGVVPIRLMNSSNEPVCLCRCTTVGTWHAVDAVSRDIDDNGDELVAQVSEIDAEEATSNRP